MNKTQDFLVEIGTEELPPKDLHDLAASLNFNISMLLKEHGIQFDTNSTIYFATPRRIAVIIKQVAVQQQDQTVERFGPAISAAYDANGAPTKAALGFASSCGVNIDQVSQKDKDNIVKLYFTQKVLGKETVSLLPGIVEAALKKLPIKKYMRWGNGDVSFVRPVHWIVMLFGKEIVPCTIWGISASNISRGHRILGDNGIKIESPDTYAKQLEEQGKITPNFEIRRERIRADINKLAMQANGTAVIDEELLNMVTGLVEHPVALIANFDANFLRVPGECLISAMQDHQKCFALKDSNGNLLPKFILISNISSTDPQTVIRGNELVMHARLADAAFYFDKDQKQTLASRREQLKNVIYLKKLGSIYDKTERIKKIAEYIQSNCYSSEDLKSIHQAAMLCKADLLTNMVYEFPELQGIMGSYYAKHDGENAAVALAIEEHYKPRFALDTLPTSNIGTIVALADRIDTIVGLFGIGNFPTGEKDPYGLRRQVIAVLRLLTENNINIDLKSLLAFANTLYDGATTSPTEQYFEFFSERIKSWYLSKSIDARTIAAVLTTLSNNPDPKSDLVDYSPSDIDKRIHAVAKFRALPEAASLAAANKRVQNLLEKSAQGSNNNVAAVDAKLFTNPEEITLYQAVEQKEKEIAPFVSNGDYSTVLQSLATLQAPVDAFFNNVMVMDEDIAKRNNRLNLLNRLRNLFLKVADISQL